MKLSCSTNLHKADFNRRPIRGILSQMQQSLVHKNIFWPLYIHIQRIPAPHVIQWLKRSFDKIPTIETPFSFGQRYTKKNEKQLKKKTLPIRLLDNR